MLKDLLKRELDKLATDLQDSLAQNNVNASGNLSRSIEVRIDDKEDTLIGQVLAERYIDFVDKGRGKTRNFTGGLLQAIKEWVKLGKYGINPSNEGIAYAITKKITNEGSFLFRNKINKNIVGKLLNENRLNDITKELSKVDVFLTTNIKGKL